MTPDKALRAVMILVVVVYLTAAGWFFLLAPWTRFWVSHVLPGAPVWLVPVLDSPMLRGALSGFGVLHFSVAVAWLAKGPADP